MFFHSLFNAYFIGIGWIFLIQALPVAGQEPSDGFEAIASISFQPDILEKPIVSREGYFQLSWDLTGVADFDGSFRVSEVVFDENDSAVGGLPDGPRTLRPLSNDSEIASTQRVIYEGALPTAFVSGLPDGTYHYRVDALDANGNLIARSNVPATVKVSHWSMWQSTVLLVIGAFVFLAVVVVIARGTLMHRCLETAVATNELSQEELAEGSRS